MAEVAIFGKLANIFRVPDLRKRVLFTLGLLAVYRIGGHIPTPGINGDRLAQFLLQRAPRLRPPVHAGLEEAEVAAAVRLGTIQRDVGVLEQAAAVGLLFFRRFCKDTCAWARNRI